jgi:hypothetical protein
MKYLLVALMLSCSSPETSLESNSVNQAVKNVLYATDGNAKCEPGFHSETFHSARCELSNGGKFYCTVSAAGFSCSPLNAKAQPIAPAQPQLANPQLPKAK